MSVWTLFANLQSAIASSGDFDESTIFQNPPMTACHNVLYYRRETLELDDNDTRSITFPDYATTQWVLIVARVIGEAKITTVGVDADGSTAIEGQTAGYGTAAHPGIVGMTTKSVTSFTLESLADATTVEYIACILAEDDDSALTANA